DGEFGCLQAGPYLDAVAELEFGDRRRCHFGDEGDRAVDVDADAVAEQVRAVDASVPDVARAAFGSVAVESDGARMHGDVDVAVGWLRSDDGSPAVDGDVVTARVTAKHVDADEISDVLGPWADGDVVDRALLSDVSL